MRPRGDEMGRFFQDRCRPALREGIERRDRRRDEAVAPRPRRFDAERRDERCLVAAGVLAGALAERQFVRLDIENIVGDLKGRAERMAIAESAARAGASACPRIAPASTA